MCFIKNKFTVLNCIFFFFNKKIQYKYAFLYAIETIVGLVEKYFNYYRKME